MSFNRFKFIKRMITFYDSTTRSDRLKKDKFQHLQRCSKCSTIHQMISSPYMKCYIQQGEVLGLIQTIKTSQLNKGLISQA